jgi:hypothetical protein
LKEYIALNENFVLRLLKHRLTNVKLISVVPLPPVTVQIISTYFRVLSISLFKKRPGGQTAIAILESMKVPGEVSVAIEIVVALYQQNFKSLTS